MTTTAPTTSSRPHSNAIGKVKLRLLRSSDLREGEGVMAWSQKREPHFKGQ